MNRKAEADEELAKYDGLKGWQVVFTDDPYLLHHECVHDAIPEIPKEEDPKGRCVHEIKTIYINIDQSQEEQHVTLLHEIAHALTPGTGHGIAWAEVGRRIGLDPNDIAKHQEQEQTKWEVVDTEAGPICVPISGRGRG